VADYLRADCLAVYVSKAPGLSRLSDEERTGLERQLNFARGLQIETRVLEGDDEAETVVGFARLSGVTQIFVMRHKDHTLCPSSGAASCSGWSALRRTCRSQWSPTDRAGSRMRHEAPDTTSPRNAAA
jgi:hypothetical protein